MDSDKVCVHRLNDRVANPATTGLEGSTGYRPSVTAANSRRGDCGGVKARVGAPQRNAAGLPEGFADATAPSSSSPQCAHYASKSVHWLDGYVRCLEDTPAGNTTEGPGWSDRPHQPVAAREGESPISPSSPLQIQLQWEDTLEQGAGWWVQGQPRGRRQATTPTEVCLKS